ncbi:MAG: SdiA-regulated domain-containing protein [Bacteroidales bacterium]|nr:SdiA-regulated domain-containing protein [Bacteroidales bacterium]
MKASRLFAAGVAALMIGLLGSCTSDKVMGMIVPGPNTKPSTGEIPGGDPFNPDDPTPTPVDPVDPYDDIVNNPERLARIGITPIIEIYYTEYTAASLFPSLEEVRNFTHINVGHVRFKDKDNGVGIEIPAASLDLVQKFNAYKAEYPGLKVKLQMGGWGKNADGWSQMARDDAKRAAFVQECVQICEQYNVDGFDIDWEYPTYAAKDGDHVNGADPSDWGNFVQLFKEMREAMPDKILSYAASDSGKYTDNAGVLPYIDYINVMTYDQGNPPYHNSSLYRSAITGSRCCAEAIEDIFHGKQGIPYQMMNFGLAFYGHGDGYKQTSGNRYPSHIDYSKLEDIFFKGTCDGMDVKGVNYRIWDDVAKVPYLADAMGRMYASYEDVESINAKVAYAKSKNMLGCMIWEYRHDNDLGTLRHCVKHAMDGNPDSPGRWERPENYTVLPEMGKHTKYVLQQGSEILPELSGLCLSKDKDFLWGIHDKGTLYKIYFNGTFEQHWYREADFEGITMDPATGDLYIGLESSSKSVYRVPAPNYNSKDDNFNIVVEGVESMGNSGVEGIAWHNGNLYFGTQTGARLFEYKLDGTQLWKKSLRDVTSTISEVGDLCYDAERDRLWVLDSNSNKDNPQYLGFTLYMFTGDASELLATYYLGDFANWNPEAVCVDHKNNCIWIGDDCDSGNPSWLHKVEFTNL